MSKSDLQDYWDEQFLKADWKKKRCQIINPNNGELLANITLTPSDFTRRSFDFKITKWHASFPKDAEIAEWWLDRGTHGGLANKVVSADAAYIRCGKKSCKKSPCR